MRISESITAYVDQRRVEGYSPHTLASYRYQLGLMQNTLGDVEVGAVTLADLRRHLGSFPNIKPGTLSTRIWILRAWGQWLYEEGHVPEDPAKRLKEPKMPARIPKALSVDDLETVRDACRTLRERALIEVLFSTGCRAGELAGIKRADVDWDRKAIVVLGKGSKEREVYLTALATIRLRRYLATRTDDCEHLFATVRRPFNRLTEHELWREVKRVGKRCGMADRVWPHVLRHTMATTMLNNGADLVAVQSLLGHEDPKTTQIYARLSGSARQRAHQRFLV